MSGAPGLLAMGSAHPWDAQVRETHSGLVFLVGERAYKAKKPVDLGFLDFSTCAARKEAIHRELLLNRRLAPDVYLGVFDVVDEAGQPCEYLLVMRRMPEQSRLSTLLEKGADVRDAVRHLARDVAAFHATARTGPRVEACGRSEALQERWVDNFAGLRELEPRRVSQEELLDLERLALDYVGGCGPLLESRIRAGMIRDGHGDLLADDIFCLPDGPRILDCLDFDDQLRFMDVLDDVGCLAMDMEHLGHPDLADQFLRWYAEFSGSPVPESLKHHYIAYRAVMRAKVTALREEADDSDEAAVEVAALCALAGRHLLAGRRTLVLIGGVPASGKTTLATALGDRLAAPMLSSDRVRKEMAGISPDDAASARFGQGIYASEMTDRTYALLKSRAASLLGMGTSVIIDASFTTASQRAPFRQVAATAQANLVEMRCVAEPRVLRERLRRRDEHRDLYTDADSVVAKQLASATEPWPQAREIDTSATVETSLKAACHNW